MATKTINLDTPTVAKAEPERKTPVYNPLPAEVQAAIEFLIQVSVKHNVLIAGYAFSTTPPRITNFGNVKDCGDLRLYVALCKMGDERRASGHVITERVLPIQ